MKLIFYDTKGNITRVMSSSRPRAKWNLSIYGLSRDEQMKLLSDSALPGDFSQSNYLFDGLAFTRLEPKLVENPLAKLEARVKALEDRQ